MSTVASSNGSGGTGGGADSTGGSDGGTGGGGDPTASTGGATSMGVGAAASISTTGVGGVGTGDGEYVDYGDLPIPDQCLTEYHTFDEEACELSLWCKPEGVDAYCELEEGTWSCACGSSYVGSVFVEFSGLSDAEVCPNAAALCFAAKETEFPPLSCEPSMQANEPTSKSCSTSTVCRANTELAEGISVTKEEWRNAACTHGLEAWTCQCDGPGLWTWFEVATPEEPAEFCFDVLDACIAGLDVQGDRTCAPLSQHVSDDECHASLDCQQTAIVANLETISHDTVPVSCVRAEESNWTCQCPLTVADGFTVTSDNSWDACLSAIETCAG